MDGFNARVTTPQISYEPLRQGVKSVTQGLTSIMGADYESQLLFNKAEEKEKKKQADALVQLSHFYNQEIKKAMDSGMTGEEFREKGWMAIRNAASIYGMDGKYLDMYEKNYFEPALEWAGLLLDATATTAEKERTAKYPTGRKPMTHGQMVSRVNHLENKYRSVEMAYRTGDIETLLAGVNRQLEETPNDSELLRLKRRYEVKRTAGQRFLTLAEKKELENALRSWAKSVNEYREKLSEEERLPTEDIDWYHPPTK